MKVGKQTGGLCWDCFDILDAKTLLPVARVHQDGDPVLVSVASLRTFANRLVKAFNAAHAGDAP